MGKKILQLSASTEAEWLEARKLGASDAGAAMGVSPFQTAFGLWAEKTGVLKQEHSEDAVERFFWGHELEPVVAKVASQRLGLPTVKNDWLYAHDVHQFMTATPDFWIDGQILQIKTTSSYNAGKFNDQIPDYIFCQIQQEMAVTGAESARVATLVGGQKLVISEPFERDDVFIAQMHEVLCDFWRKVEAVEAPAVVASDGDTVSAIFPTASDREVTLDDRFVELVEQRAALIPQIKALESEKARIEAAIKFEMGDAATAMIGKYRAGWELVERKGFVAQPTSFRRFTVK